MSAPAITVVELAEEMLAAIPDDIQFFRALRVAGRSDYAKAMALDAYFEPVRKALAEIRDNTPCPPVY